MTTTKTGTSTRARGTAQTAARLEDERRPVLVKGAKKPASRRTAAATPTERIRERAYYLSLERNGGAADPLGDWLRAERELAKSSGEAAHVP